MRWSWTGGGKTTLVLGEAGVEREMNSGWGGLAVLGRSNGQTPVFNIKGVWAEGVLGLGVGWIMFCVWIWIRFRFRLIIIIIRVRLVYGLQKDQICNLVKIEG